jgi:hypothetical protein
MQNVKERVREVFFLYDIRTKSIKAPEENCVVISRLYVKIRISVGDGMNSDIGNVE